MLRHENTINYVSPLGVTKQMRDAVASRKGDWEVETYDWDWESPDFGCWGRLAGLTAARLCGYGRTSGKFLQKTTLVLQEKEIPRILHIFTHGKRNNTKMTSVHANLEQCAETLWPSGSLEHVAMRFLAVPILCRVFAGHRLKASKFHSSVLGCLLPGKEHYRTRLYRRTEDPSGAVNHNGGNAGPIQAEPTSAKGTIGKEPVAQAKNFDKKSSLQPSQQMSSCRELVTGFPVGGVSGGTSPGGSGPDAPDVPQTSLGRVIFKHGGKTPEDADILACELERLFEHCGVKMIVGQDYGFGEDIDRDNKQIVGVLTSPTPKKPNVYSKSSRNALAAKQKRLDEKARPYTGTKDDEKKIKRFIGDACGYKQNRALFSETRIRRWAERFLHLEEIKSGKWSEKQLSDSLANLFTQAYPKLDLKCDVKLEPMQEGKPPRLLIADGDSGQLMALIVVKCMEDLLFDWFEEKSIKHAGKRKAIKRVIRCLTKSGAKLIEGDGSAWDTTCNVAVRGLVENPVLKHIMQVLIPYGVVPQQWHEEHMRCNDKKKLKLFFEKKLDKLRITIDAIRRSGHRGTSCLNWWQNFTHWTCAIFKEPERFLDPTVRKGEDVTGVMRWFMGAFEGDDSLCALYPPLKQGDELDKMFIGHGEGAQRKPGWWERMGFNMVLVYATQRATFCGYHIACENGEPTGFAVPELPRALVGAGVSCSTTIIKAAKAGDIGTVRDIAAAGALARAADFAGLFPTVSRKFHEYAMSVKRSREVVDREMSMRVMGEEGHNFTAIEHTIEAQNLQVTPTEELANLRAVGCPATLKELDTFMVHEWTFESIGEFEAHRASLPESWRPKD